jgi:D-alanyl-D-alanine carboxypeptidase
VVEAWIANGRDGAGALRFSLRIVAYIALLGALVAPAMAKQAPAYIVVDARSGDVLDHRDAGTLWYPASITKIMTAYVTFKAMQAGRLKPTSPVVISKNALAEPPSKMGYKVGTVMNIDNALKMMLVKSANDIAVAVAEMVGGSEAKFVDMMNAEARRLGMTSTHFNNPNGLPDDGQVSTARDLAVLARAAWRDFPEYREYFRIPAIRVGNKVLRNYNTLLERYRGTNGMKTGFICNSGFNVVVSASRMGRTLITVVLGSENANDRAELAARLLNKGFGTLITVGKPSLENFRAGPARGQPVNMREQVCTKKPKAVEDEEVANLPSALVPRFKLAEPVRVVTGNADPVAKPAPNIPLPRFRPQAAGEHAARAYAPVGRAESPTSIQLGEPLQLVQ